MAKSILSTHLASEWWTDGGLYREFGSLPQANIVRIRQRIMLQNFAFMEIDAHTHMCSGCVCVVRPKGDSSVCLAVDGRESSSWL